MKPEEKSPILNPASAEALDLDKSLSPVPVSRPILSSPIVLGEITMASAETQTTVGAAGGASALPATPTGYLKLMVGDTEFVIPYYAPA